MYSLRTGRVKAGFRRRPPTGVVYKGLASPYPPLVGRPVLDGPAGCEI